MDLLIVFAFVQAAFLLYLASRLWPQTSAEFSTRHDHTFLHASLEEAAGRTATERS